MVPKRFKKCFFLWFLVFSNFFEIFRFFSQNDVFRLFAHDYSFLIEKSFKSPRNMAYFVPNFVLNFSPKSIRVHQVQPTHKWAKIAEKSFKMGLLGTQISRDLDRNRKTPSLEISPFFTDYPFSKRFSVWFNLLWGLQKIASFETQYFDLRHQINAWAYKKLLIDFNLIDAVLT